MILLASTRVMKDNLPLTPALTPLPSKKKVSIMTSPVASIKNILEKKIGVNKIISLLKVPKKPSPPVIKKAQIDSPTPAIIERNLRRKNTIVLLSGEILSLDEGEMTGNATRKHSTKVALLDIFEKKKKKINYFPSPKSWVDKIQPLSRVFSVPTSPKGKMKQEKLPEISKRLLLSSSKYKQKALTDKKPRRPNNRSSLNLCC